MKRYDPEDQAALAAWSLDCAERVLPLYYEVADDPRPRDAIRVGQRWVELREFSMAEIRGASLGAHDAAKQVKDHDAACQAAHAAGQAVATAHVTQHAYGGAYYALRAVAAASSEDARRAVNAEREWQLARLPEHLREEAARRVVVSDAPRGRVKVTVVKGPDF